MEHNAPAPKDRLTIDSLVALVGTDSFEAACHQAMSVPNESIASEAPHDLSGRLWFDGKETFDERLTVAVELYWRMPCYANLMYWRYADFEEATRDRMWDAFRDFLSDPRDAVAEPIAYSLWVDYFEDTTTVERAWREVSGPQEPRRSRLLRVVPASGPVPWNLKESLYQRLSAEGGWNESLLEGLYGSCVDIYGSVEREPALRILRALSGSDDNPVFAILARALADPRLPLKSLDRRAFVAGLIKNA